MMALKILQYKQITKAKMYLKSCGIKTKYSVGFLLKHSTCLRVRKLHSLFIYS